MARRPDEPQLIVRSVSSARWDGALGEYILDWEDAVAGDDPHALALDFRPLRVRACM